MAARSSWKGFLRIRLVSIPVKAYTATAKVDAEAPQQLSPLLRAARPVAVCTRTLSRVAPEPFEKLA